MITTVEEVRWYCSFCKNYWVTVGRPPGSDSCPYCPALSMGDGKAEMKTYHEYEDKTTIWVVTVGGVPYPINVCYMNMDAALRMAEVIKKHDSGYVAACGGVVGADPITADSKMIESIAKALGFSGISDGKEML